MQEARSLFITLCRHLFFHLHMNQQGLGQAVMSGLDRGEAR